MKISVVGLGSVGLSNVVLLAQNNEVIGVDISRELVDALNAKKSPIIDAELSDYLAKKERPTKVPLAGMVMREPDPKVQQRARSSEKAPGFSCPDYFDHLPICNHCPNPAGELEDR